MSDEFREMAAKAKAEHLNKVSDRQKTEAEAARSEYLAAGESVLNAHVVPLLEQAQAGLKAESIELLIEREPGRGYSGKNPSLPGSNPSVTIKIHDSDRGASRACTFSSDGELIFAEMERDQRRDNKKLSAPSDKAGALVKNHVKMVLDAYFGQLPDK